MKKRIITSIALTAGFAFSAPSMAVLNIYSNEALVAEKAAKQGQYSFSQTGLSPEETHVVRANVSNMPLEMALSTLTNNEWKVIINEEAKNMPVSFKGGQSWPYILERLSIDNNLKSNIDWEYRIVTVFSPEAREKAIADRRQELIRKEMNAIQDLKNDVRGSKKDYANYVNSKNDEIMNGSKQKEIKETYHHQNKLGDDSSDSLKNSNHNKSHANNSSNEISKDGNSKSHNESDSNETYGHQYYAEDGTINSNNRDLMKEYLDYKENNRGYPFERLSDDAPYDYIIQKDDTLWDISDSFLHNPWFWPEIWYINPYIDNPHLIYPGDSLLIDPSKEN